MRCAMVDEAIGLRRLGRTSLRLTELGFGAAGIGNLYAPVDDRIAGEALDMAWHAGVRYVDTAPYYGFGLSERRVGDALRRHARDGDAWIASTKVGRLLRPRDGAPLDQVRHGFAGGLPFDPYFDYSYDGVMRSFDDSMQRMNLPAIDILLVHDIGRATHGDACHAQGAAFWDGGYRALERLRAEGRIKAIGLGVNEWQVCEEFMARADFDCFLLAGRYTLLEQGALERFMPECERRGIGLVLGGIYNSGILATGVSADGGGRYDYAPAPSGVIERVRRLQQVCDSHGVSLAAAALQFPLAHPQVASVIPGATSPEEFAAGMAHYREPIPAGLWSDLRNEELIAAAAPVPSGRHALATGAMR